MIPEFRIEPRVRIYESKHNEQFFLNIWTFRRNQYDIVFFFINYYRQTEYVERELIEKKVKTVNELYSYIQWRTQDFISLRVITKIMP